MDRPPPLIIAPSENSEVFCGWLPDRLVAVMVIQSPASMPASGSEILSAFEPPASETSSEPMKILP